MDGKGTKTLIDDAYLKIKNLIFQRKIVPGQKLIYKDFCEMFNMSRTPIISALTRLEQEGFLISAAFQGFRVKPMDVQETWDLFGIREALEAYAVELAIERGDQHGMDLLEEKLQNHAQYTPKIYDSKKFMLDAEFHAQIAAMTGNKVLLEMLSLNLEHVNLRFRHEGCDPSRMPAAVEGHEKLFQSIKKKDLRSSIEIIKLHVRSGRDTCLNSLIESQSISA